MTDMPFESGVFEKKQVFVGRSSTFSVKEMYWGYVVRSSRGAGIEILIAQVVAMIAGACLMSVAIAIWLVPVAVEGPDVWAMRIGGSVISASIAALLLWYASRGTKTEIHVDNSLGEVREVIRNRTGRTTVAGRYGFDSIGGVFLDRQSGRHDEATLVLRYQNTAQTVYVAQGSQDVLRDLCHRMGRDLMVERPAGYREAAAQVRAVNAA